MQSFSQLGVSRASVNALSAGGIEQPFPIQEMVIGDVLAGHDVLVRSPTGSGKTLAFGIPIVDRIASDGPRPAALILAPTRELATQIACDIRGIAHARALRVTAVYGGVGLVKPELAVERDVVVGGSSRHRRRETITVPGDRAHAGQSARVLLGSWSSGRFLWPRGSYL